MVLAIHRSIPAMNTQRNVLRMSREKDGVASRVSSGLELKRTVDDLQGVSIGIGMTARIRGINQTMRNVNEAVSLVQVAQTAIDETATALQTIRALAIQAANDTMTTDERWNLQHGVRQLLEEIDRIARESADEGLEREQVGLLPVTGDGKDGDGEILQAIKEAMASSLLRMGQAIRQSTRDREYPVVSHIDKMLDLATDISTRLDGYQDQVNELIAHLEEDKASRVTNLAHDGEKNESRWTVEAVRDALIENADAAIQTQANQGPKLVLELLDG
ncbi:MAG: hypothetical protein HQL76_05385 [Magnetococcales bacterium]|nr:hypothetical protein [Magnetococcales bacterium]